MSRPLADMLYAGRCARTVAASHGRRAFHPKRRDGREKRGLGRNSHIKRGQGLLLETGWKSDERRRAHYTWN